jgi:hypothetical protein
MSKLKDLIKTIDSFELEVERLKEENRELALRNCDLIARNNLLETRIDLFHKAGLAYNYILPEPHIDIKECVTNGELYRVQHKLAKKQWSAALNHLNKFV